LVLSKLYTFNVFIYGRIGAETTIEKVIEQILSKHPEISKDEILERMEKEKHKMGGFISDETLLRLVAAGFDVEVQNNKVLSPVLSFEDLIPGLNNVTVVGRVVAVFPPKSFNGVRSGKVASLLVIDKDALLRVVFWNDKTSFIESGSIKTGQIVRFSHGYTKEDRSGKVELHIGERCEVEVNPHDADGKDYPTIHKFSTRIREITEVSGNKRVNVAGTVDKVFPSTTFERQDLSSGKVMRFVLRDETGEISIVVWNEKVDELERKLAMGVVLQIVDAKVRKSMNGCFEVHVDAGTFVQTLEQPTS
jgi:ssDNA-binding replication factor A large subunit